MQEIMLRNQDGYYAEKMKVRGATFHIRELPDDAYDKYLETRAQLSELGGMNDLLAGDQREEVLGLLAAFKALPEDLAERAPTTAAEIILQNQQASSRLEELLMLAGIDPQEPGFARQLRQLRRSLNEGIVVGGVASWDLTSKGKAIDCTDENKAALPDTVQAVLAGRILALTELQAAELPFS
jgi:dsDNA-binding SOS-regulon protein